jgi:sugar phosphate isomerase/epimerase
VAFEPLHPVLMNVDGFICTLSETQKLVQVVEHSAFGVAWDAWHLWQEEQRAAHLEALRDKVFVVHFSDWSDGGPRHVDDRASPGEGRLPLKRMLAEVEATGFSGPYCLEILSALELPASLWREAGRDVLAPSVNRVASIWPR